MKRSIISMEADKRTRNMTEKGYEQYVSNRDHYIKSLSRVAKDIEIVCTNITSEEFPDLLDSNLNNLELLLRTYVEKSDEFVDFLNRSTSGNAQQALSEHNVVRDSVTKSTENVIKTYRQKVNPVESHPVVRPTSKAPSHASHTSGKRAKSKASSHRSSASSLLMQQKAKAEAARKRLEFMQEETDLITKKAEYEANAIIQQAQLDAAEKRLSAKKERCHSGSGT